MKNGFTLIELLVAIAIIGILASVLLVALNPLEQLKKSRDAQRKSDLVQIQKPLEEYYNDHGSYPASLPFGEKWEDSGKVYMEKVPQDSDSTKTYSYEIENGGYRLFAKLERCSDYQVFIGAEQCLANPQQNNFTVASSNLLVPTPPIVGQSVGEGGVVVPTATTAPTATPGPTATLTLTPTVTPTSTPPPSAGFKYVFATSNIYNGNLKTYGGSTTTGMQGADNLCTSSADASTLSILHNKKWKAWLSDSTQSPSTRNWWQGEYRLPDGVTVVANNWADLTDGSLQHAIDKNEFGNPAPAVASACSGSLFGHAVHTSTNNAGTIFSSPNYFCSDWTSGSSSLFTAWGNSSRLDGGWTSMCSGTSCADGAALYCFEQEAPQDVDDDGYQAGPTGTICPNGSLCDCDDFNNDVHPDQTSYFPTAIVDVNGTSSKNGTFDYDCDGNQTPRPDINCVANISAGSGDSTTCRSTSTLSNVHGGYVSSVPSSCGGTATFRQITRYSSLNATCTLFSGIYYCSSTTFAGDYKLAENYNFPLLCK